MSEPNKQKKKCFMLPSSLRHLQQQKQTETQEFIHQLNEPTTELKQKKQVKHSSLFKFNLQSSAIVSEVPVDTLRKRSKSQKLQSLHSEHPEVFSLLDHYKETQTKQVQQKHNNLRKYQNIDLRQMAASQGKLPPKFREQQEQPQKYQIVKPSQTYQIQQDISNSIFQPTIFQTPILPCFASELRGSSQGNKCIREGEGVWRIGKMKVKGGRCELRIGEFQFQGSRVKSEGTAGVVSGSSLHMLPSWSGMWLLQPHQSVFI